MYLQTQAALFYLAHSSSIEPSGGLDNFLIKLVYIKHSRSRLSAWEELSSSVKSSLSTLISLSSFEFLDSETSSGLLSFDEPVCIKFVSSNNFNCLYRTNLDHLVNSKIHFLSFQKHLNHIHFSNR